MNNYQRTDLNGSYSDAAEARSMNDDFQSKSTSKFCFVVSIKNSIMIIGGLEVFYAIVQLLNIFISVRVGLTCFLLFNLPLMGSWLQSQKFKRLGDLQSAYQWNSYFMTVYWLRLLVLIIGGFVFLVVANNGNSTIDFLCDRYYGADPSEAESQEELTRETDELNECRFNLRLLGLLLYVPTVVF